MKTSSKPRRCASIVTLAANGEIAAHWLTGVVSRDASASKNSAERERERHHPCRSYWSIDNNCHLEHMIHGVSFHLGTKATIRLLGSKEWQGWADQSVGHQHQYQSISNRISIVPNVSSISLIMTISNIQTISRPMSSPSYTQSGI